MSWSDPSCCDCCLWFLLQYEHLSLLSRAAAVLLESCLGQGAGGEGQTAQAESLGGLGAAKTGRAAAVTAASVEAAAEKPTAGWPPAAAL